MNTRVTLTSSDFLYYVGFMPKSCFVGTSRICESAMVITSARSLEIQKSEGNCMYF